MKVKSFLVPNERWRDLLGSVMEIPPGAVVIPASSGPWLRNAIPSLWNLGPRLLLIDGPKVTVFSMDIPRTIVRAEKWSGNKEDWRVKSYLGERVARITPLRKSRGPTLQIDGKDSVRRLLEAFSA
jgi:hypothetical protein